MLMSTFEIPATDYTPHVFEDSKTGVIWFKGEAYPENASAYFQPIMEWIRSQIAEKQPLKLAFSLDYLNTSSTKALLDLLAILEIYHQQGGKVSVIWYYQCDLEVMKETGEELLHDFSLPRLLEPVGRLT